MRDSLEKRLSKEQTGADILNAVYENKAKQQARHIQKEKGPSSPLETKKGPEGPSLRPAPLGGGRALRERGVPSSRGLAPQYFGRWRA